MGRMKELAMEEQERSVLAPLFDVNFYEIEDADYNDHITAHREITEEIAEEVEEEEFLNAFVKANRFALVLLAKSTIKL
mgnify:FL=1|tara:strand:- start:1065 stop:1301 length:237 start_codon:yes stop_codon:yes gene_type:complete